MSRAHPVIPGQTLMVSRRCTQRQFLCLPDNVVNQVLGFLLAVAARDNGIVVHAYCVMSNHIHIIFTDVRGNRPEFFRWFFEFSAKCLNVHWGRWENFWSAGRPSRVLLIDSEAQLAKLVYVITNPVKANLVTAAHHWPGLISLPAKMGRAQVFRRPSKFFRAEGPLPAEATLRIEPLPAFSDLPAEDYRALIAQAVAATETELAEHRRQEGRRVLRRREVLRQSPFDRPQNHAPRRRLNPRVACRDKWARIEALSRLKAFESSYRKAWRRWCQGEHDVIFPYGTYALRLHAGVCCAGPP